MLVHHHNLPCENDYVVNIKLFPTCYFEFRVRKQPDVNLLPCHESFFRSLKTIQDYLRNDPNVELNTGTLFIPLLTWCWVSVTSFQGFPFGITHPNYKIEFDVFFILHVLYLNIILKFVSIYELLSQNYFYNQCWNGGRLLQQVIKIFYRIRWQCCMNRFFINPMGTHYIWYKKILMIKSFYT